MKKLFLFLKDYKKETVLGPLLKLFEASLELLVPIIVADIIDKGIIAGDKSQIFLLSLDLLGHGILGLLLSVTAQYFAAKASIGFVCRIRAELFRHITRLSYTQTDTVGTSTLITRLTNDINQVQSGMNLGLRLLLRSPFIVFGSMIMAFTIDVRSALIFTVAIPLLSVVVFGIMLLCIPLYKKVQSHLDRVLLRTRENLTGARVIRAFCKENDETADFTDESNNLTDIQKRVGHISALLNPLTYVIINFAIIVLIYTGALRVEAGILTQGAVVALYNYMSQILVELIKLANLIINITKAIACGNRIEAVLELEAEKDVNKAPDLPSVAEYAVEFKNVSLRYKNAGDKALSGISFKAKKGETVGIIGSTGSGKTSLINLIPRFYSATDGDVFINGIPVSDYPADMLRKKIGIVPQKAVLFKGTLRENLRWGKSDASDQEIYNALSFAQIDDFVKENPQGLDYELEQGGKNLSGGQRQRLTVARAIIRHPEILILDDSTSALDFATEARLRQSVLGLSDDITVFIVSQRASSVQYCDLILVLEDGELVGSGNHDELIRDCEVYREIYSSQFEEVPSNE